MAIAWYITDRQSHCLYRISNVCIMAVLCQNSDYLLELLHDTRKYVIKY